MKILLVNPNRYRTPPVPPLALEYLHTAVSRTRHESRVLDLCFSENIAADIAAAMADFRPDVVGLTIRNIDTVLMHNNVFFLDDHRSVVEQLKMHGTPVIAGGTGFSFTPQTVRDYLGADYGISGPGELALTALLDQLEHASVKPGTVLEGWEYGIDPQASTRREGVVDYAAYLSEGGLLGFETQKGCFTRCSYCREGHGRVIFKSPTRVVEELQDLAARGLRNFHLCDTEFNQDLSHCREFLTELIAADCGLHWAVYMKTSPYDAELFQLMQAAGVDLITVSHPTGPRGLEHLSEIRRLTRRHKIRLAVDYLCGLPGETLESVRNCIEHLRRIEPDTVGVNSALRLYPGLPLTDHVLSDPQCHASLRGTLDSLPDCTPPVFYQRITPQQLRDMLGDDPRFCIEGFGRTTNYQRV